MLLEPSFVMGQDKNNNLNNNNNINNNKNTNNDNNKKII